MVGVNLGRYRIFMHRELGDVFHSGWIFLDYYIRSCYSFSITELQEVMIHVCVVKSKLQVALSQLMINE